MRRRLLASYLALTLVVVVVLEVPLALSYGDRARQQLSTELQRNAFAVASVSEETLEGDAHVDLQHLADGFQRQMGGHIVIVNSKDKVVADTQPSSPGDAGLAGSAQIRSALGGHIVTGSLPNGSLDTDVLYVAMPVNPEGRVLGVIRISYSARQLDQRIYRYWLGLALVAAAALAAAALAGVVFSTWVTRPLRGVRDAARQLGAGDLAARANQRTGPPEVRDLSRAFDTMAARLEELVGSHTAFVADASHQLRTPLTALRLRLENLASEVEDPEAAEDLEAARAESTRLSRLVDGLLLLARADRREVPEGADVEIDLDALAEERLEIWRPIADEYGLHLASSPRGLAARGSRDDLVQVLDNLLANAMEASPAGCRIRVESVPSSDGRWVELHVIDQGPGLDPMQRSAAFNRFWRAGRTEDDSGRGQLGGSGLGLAIVRQLVMANRGEADLLEAPGGGLDAVVRLRPGTRRAPVTVRS